jgi:hypothetical protein
MSNHNYIISRKPVSVLENSHLNKRESRLGRWAPVGFFSVNIITWFSIGLAAGVWDLLPLVLLPLLVLALYLVRTGGPNALQV